MKKKNQKLPAVSRLGFSLLELIAAMAMFMIVAGAAVTLVRRHVPLFSSQQQQVGLNFSMRNAAAQMQIDVVNAGSGFGAFTNTSVPIVAILVTPPPAVACNPAGTQTYSAGCFDTLNVLQVDQSVAPAHPINNGTGCDSTTASTLFITPADATVPLSTESDGFNTGDFVLVINTDGAGQITSMAPVVLTKDSQVSGGKVKISHDPQGSLNGNNLGLSIQANNKLGVPACGTSSWVVKLQPPLSYFVDTTTAADPKLVRQVGNAAPDLVAEQIIGFKVGISVWNGAAIDNRYLFLPADAADPSYNTANIRSVMVSLIGRTASGGVDAVPNAVDGGLYKIEAASVVINPRNLSMGDSN